MTNRKSLAIIIPMLLATSSGVNALDIFNKNGNKLELHGSINPNHEFSHGFLSTKFTSDNDNTNAVLGLSGKMNITDKLLSYAAIEYKTNFFSPEELLHQQQSNIRLGYAGFKYGNWGSIDYGRNYGIFYDVQSLTDHVPYINKNSLFNKNDNYMIGRSNSLLTYRNNNFFGLFDGVSFALQYQDKTGNRDLNSKERRGHNGWGASLKYETKVGLTAVGSFFSSHRSSFSSNENSKDSKVNFVGAYGLGFKYDANDIYVAAFYGEGRNLTPSLNFIGENNNSHQEKYLNKTQNIEAIAEYNFHSGFHPSLSYLDSKGQNSNGLNNLDLAKQINIATRYEFNKNISTYMNYKINLLKNDKLVEDNNNVAKDNIIGAGIVYQF